MAAPTTVLIKRRVVALRARRHHGVNIELPQGERTWILD